MLEFGYKEPGILEDGAIRLSLCSYIEDVDKTKSHVPFYEFDIVDVKSGERAGGIVLRAGYNPHVVNCAGHIGYGVNEEHRGKRFAARASRLVSSFAARIGMPYLVITTRPDNTASIRSAVLAGFDFVGTAAVPEDDEMFLEGERVMNRYILILPSQGENA